MTKKQINSFMQLNQRDIKILRNLIDCAIIRGVDLSERNKLVKIDDKLYIQSCSIYGETQDELDYRISELKKKYK